jgi:hypothetical protein
LPKYFYTFDGINVGVNVNVPFAFTSIVPTPGIVAVVPAENDPEMPAIVN